MESFKLLSIRMHPVCHGPITFLVNWECGKCHAKNTLIKKMSLLPAENVNCGICGSINHYEYPLQYFAELKVKLGKISQVEFQLLDETRKAGDSSLLELGNNFNFILSTMIYNSGTSLGG